MRINTITYLSRIRTFRQLFRWVEGHLMVPYQFSFTELKTISNSERMHLAGKIFEEHAPLIKLAIGEEQERRGQMPIGILYNLLLIQNEGFKDATSLAIRYKKELVEAKQELSALRRKSK